MAKRQKKINYLNNRDILSEIHKSKTSFSRFTDPSYHQYDFIVEDINDINSEAIEQAKLNRSKRLFIEENIEPQSPARVPKNAIDPSTISITDLIFRVMTWDHIPETLSDRKKNRGIHDEKERVNFSPFQHWKYDDNLELICVGKSHWTGDIHTGHFDARSGQISNTLALMYQELCRQCTNHRWYRGFSYTDEMQLQALCQLVQVGLKFNELKSDNPFAYLSSIAFNAFKRIKEIEKDHQDLRDDLLQHVGLNPSYNRSNDFDTSFDSNMDW